MSFLVLNHVDLTRKKAQIFFALIFHQNTTRVYFFQNINTDCKLISYKNREKHHRKSQNQAEERKKTPAEFNLFLEIGEFSSFFMPPLKV